MPPSHVTGVARTREENAAWTAAGVEIPRPCGKARWHSVTLSPSKPASRDSPVNDSHVNRKHGAVGTPAAAVFKTMERGKTGRGHRKGCHGVKGAKAGGSSGVTETLRATTKSRPLPPAGPLPCLTAGSQPSAAATKAPVLAMTRDIAPTHAV